MMRAKTGEEGVWRGASSKQPAANTLGVDQQEASDWAMPTCVSGGDISQVLAFFRPSSHAR